jgi:hypothetical protein
MVAGAAADSMVKDCAGRDKPGNGGNLPEFLRPPHCRREAGFLWNSQELTRHKRSNIT